jgi:hypothetical protein
VISPKSGSFPWFSMKCWRTRHFTQCN